MYHKLYLRDVPTNAEYLVDLKVKIPLPNGKFEIRELNKPHGKMKVYSETWHAKVKCYSGPGDKGKWVEIALCKDKANARHLLAMKEKEERAKKAGTWIEPPKEPDPLQTYIDRWIKDKHANKRLKRYVVASEYHVNEIFKSLSVKTIADIKKDSFEKDLQGLIDKWVSTPKAVIDVPNAPEFTLEDISNMFKFNRRNAYRITYDANLPYEIRDGIKYFKKVDIDVLAHKRGRTPAKGTINMYIGHIKDFLNYLVRLEVIPRSVTPPYLNNKDDKRKVRRAVTWEECLQLCNSVMAINETLRGMGPFERSVLYRTAFCTLARRRALMELRLSDLYLDSKVPFISIRAETDKTGTNRSIPVMQKDLIADLKALTLGKTRGDLVFNIPDHTSYNLQKDITAANMQFKTIDGDWDFHAFRHSGATHMARMYVPLYQICKIGGWTNYDMFFQTYGHLTIEDLGKSVEGIF